ncbi:toxin-antitoxin system HicB family antitoxin [Skermania piniformis]|uniref:Toxin-antitoxin system HicB family antitoxin n=1 Tax=Skermania pinensis TaxID=39122 RepID=A0ABX8S444_9ACTN|nr:toxin-antitoxin system HicB family antitoxin [Skermania piniformis]QXQ12609.1 toxin-antitoxin system HicB family antitoxin [Skermania piniformis]
MDLTPYTRRLHTDLQAAAALGDEHTQATAAALGTAAENSARLMLLSALAEFAAEVSAALAGPEVHVRLAGTDVVVDVRSGDTVMPDPEPVPDPDQNSEPDPNPKAATDQPPSFEELTGDISRVTLRLVEQLKARAEEAAAQNGQSLNSWVSQAVQGALADHRRRYGYGPWQR